MSINLHHPPVGTKLVPMYTDPISFLGLETTGAATHRLLRKLNQCEYNIREKYKNTN